MCNTDCTTVKRGHTSAKTGVVQHTKKLLTSDEVITWLQRVITDPRSLHSRVTVTLVLREGPFVPKRLLTGLTTGLLIRTHFRAVGTADVSTGTKTRTNQFRPIYDVARLLLDDV